MTDLQISSEMFVELVDFMGDDQAIANAARVSTLGGEEPPSSGLGLINFLMKNRHGTPFEHGVMKFRITAPIFVWREFMRHRIASYNEESARYKKLEPMFYLPDNTRKIIQTGKPGHYIFEEGEPWQRENMNTMIIYASEQAYQAYELILSGGIARELARMVLPVNIYSTAYVTINLRSLMNFLSLRTKRDNSLFPSFPQREIEMVADKMEVYFKEYFPVVFTAFDSNGRVAP